VISPTAPAVGGVKKKKAKEEKVVISGLYLLSTRYKQWKRGVTEK
jgi:hypothetical protein